MDANIRISGAAGQGVQSLGDILAHGFASMGLHVFASQEYLSRIRGGVNSYDVRISGSELFCGRGKADLLVALTDEAFAAHKGDLDLNGLIIRNTSERGDFLSVDLAGEAKAAGGAPLMGNTVAAGAVFGVLDYDVEILCRFLSEQFGKKGEEVVEKNAACARRGAASIAGHEGLVRAPKPSGAPAAVYSGSDAVGLSAATAGVRLVCSYPMSPSTGVFTYLAGAAKKYGILVEQAEDEICAMNLINGAVYAGAPAMTTTSGGGFSLMAEGLSLAGMLELPVVIMLAQRPGPATGLPTRTAQGDLAFAVHAGHGEFPRIILAPGSPRQAFDLTRRAFELAHKFQTPAIILADQFLCDSQKNIQALPEIADPVDRHIATDAGPEYMRYVVAPGGVSPRAIPGGDALVLCTSDEHSEDGRISEDPTVRTAMHQKRMSKYEGIIKEFLEPEIYPEPTENVLLCWGSTYGPCREAVDRLRRRGGDVCMVHLPQVWPLNADCIRAALDGKRVTAVELNFNAQLTMLLKQIGALGEFNTILKYDGFPFTGEEIAGRFTP